jgi:hypothetical protein
LSARSGSSYTSARPWSRFPPIIAGAPVTASRVRHRPFLAADFVEHRTRVLEHVKFVYLSSLYPIGEQPFFWFTIEECRSR